MLKVGLVPRSCKSLKASTDFTSCCLLFDSPVLLFNWQGVCVRLQVPVKVNRGRLYSEEITTPRRTRQTIEPISKFSGSLFDTDDKMRDRRNTRPSLQEKHRSAMKGKSNLRVQPPSSAAGCFPSESGQILEELRAVDVPQPPLKITITVCSQMGSLGISIAGGKGSSPCKDNDEQGMVTARLPKDGPADLAGVQAGDRVAEASLASERDALHAGPTEASSKDSPCPAVNHIITIPRIILTRPSTSDEDMDQVPPDPDDFEPEELDSGEGHTYLDSLNSAFYPP
ncbi:uncharacterized protein LOC135176656 [Pogoniulus pusillus]|uniref:uncharacterized protein LOC135176656 n=1 Tax=Pogoniulus pusillus TaxID=488313 RepID=UPI0030B99B8E